MFDKEWFAEEVYSRFGDVKRARGCFLYTASQVRLTDMFQEAGRAILGWSGGKAKLEFKNALERGYTGSFRSKYEHQFKKAVNCLLPDYPNVRWYFSKESLFRALSGYLGIEYSSEIPESPILANLSDLHVDAWLKNTNVCRWRPWLEDAWFFSFHTVPAVLQEALETPPKAIVICPPFPWSETTYLVAYGSEDEDKIQPSDFVSPPLLAAGARAMYDLYAALPTRGEDDWKVYDEVLLKYFERRGPYLISKVPKEKYKDFFIHCLERHIVISPSFDTPSIVPFGADIGVFRKLKREPFNWE